MRPEEENLVNTFFPDFCMKNIAMMRQEKLNDKVCKADLEKIKQNQFRKEIDYCKHLKNKDCEICNKIKNYLHIDTIEYFLNAHEKVVESGKFNFEGCKIKVNDRMNFEFLRDQLKDYKDTKLCDLLEFGFPIGYLGQGEILNKVQTKEIWKFRNHKGAEEFPDAMLEYLEKEASNKAIIGPFKSNPFKEGLKISPVNSLPKKDTDERRVILDLSFPKGLAVNDFISKDEYLGEKIEVIYPKVDDFIHLIKVKGQGCLLFKVDLRRFYRQIYICPSSLNLVSFVWKKHIFCDTVLSMGCRSSAYLAQRFSNAITFILFKVGI